VKLCVTILNYTEFHKDHAELHRGINQMEKVNWGKTSRNMPRFFIDPDLVGQNNRHFFLYKPGNFLKKAKKKYSQTPGILLDKNLCLKGNHLLLILFLD